MSKTYLGVDIGGTAVKLGLVDENGRVLRRAERSVSFDGYKTPILDTVQAAIHEFLTADAPRLEGIAVSATGQIDSRRGAIQNQESTDGTARVTAMVPLSEMFGYATDLRSKTQGRGQYVMEPSHYEPVPKNIADQIIAGRTKG